MRTESKYKQTAQARENTSDQVTSGFRFELIWLIDGVARGLWTNYRAKFKATLMGSALFESFRNTRISLNQSDSRLKRNKSWLDRLRFPTLQAICLFHFEY